jgi:hypothetical protein
MKCPICDAEMKRDQSYNEHVLMEEYFDCPNGHYHYEYVTGYTEITIGDEEFTIGYNDTKEEWNAFRSAVADAVARMKR